MLLHSAHSSYRLGYRFLILVVATALSGFALRAELPLQTQLSAMENAAGSSKAMSAYGDLPLGFEANQGQTDASVQFLSHGQGYTLFLKPNEAVFALRRAKPEAAHTKADSLATISGKNQPGEFDLQMVRMLLVGANARAEVAREDQQITRTNYFLGNDPSKWRTDIPNFSRIRYQSVYDGIDLVFYGNQRQLEHDFIVAPNANPAHIVLQMQGAKSLRIDQATGDLIITTSGSHSEMRLLKPVTYQEKKRKAYACYFKL